MIILTQSKICQDLGPKVAVDRGAYFVVHQRPGSCTTSVLDQFPYCQTHDRLIQGEARTVYRCFCGGLLQPGVLSPLRIECFVEELVSKQTSTKFSSPAPSFHRAAAVCMRQAWAVDSPLSLFHPACRPQLSPSSMTDVRMLARRETVPHERAEQVRAGRPSSFINPGQWSTFTSPATPGGRVKEQFLHVHGDQEIPSLASPPGHPRDLASQRDLQRYPVGPCAA